MEGKAKEIVVISGKGGTGKTSIAGGFASLSENAVLCDCDVDAANLGLILNPKLVETHEFYVSNKAHISENKCTHCGLCIKHCRFDAIKNFRVEKYSCEGCGICARLCPVGAIEMRPVLSGHWFISNTRNGTLVHASLEPGEENSGKLVTLVREKAHTVAQEEGKELIITDGPPGIGCPVIASLSGADLALVVTEPTLSGLHDLERVLHVCRHFNVSAGVCINKYDINSENSQEIEKRCKKNDVPLLGKIPYDENVPKAMVNGIPVTQYNCPASLEIRHLWESVTAEVKEEGQ